MKFSHWCLRLILTVFAIFGCTGYYPTGYLTVRRSFVCRVYGFLLLLMFFTYYCFSFNHTEEFFLKTGGTLNLIYFEFCLYWCVSLTAFAATILNGRKIAAWFGHVMTILRGFGGEEVSALIASLTLNTAVYFVLLPVYVYISMQSRNQPSSSLGDSMLYLSLCGVDAVIILEVMMGKSFLAFILKQLHLQLSETLRHDLLLNDIDHKKDFRTKNVQEIMRNHYKFSKLEFEFNSLFSIQLLLFTLLNFVELTYSIYYLISTDRYGKLILSTKMQLVFGICYFLFYFIQFLQYNISHELVQDQIIQDTINSTLSEIDEKDALLQNTLETFLIQCANLRVNATAGGFFKIGHNLLGNMFGAVTSALIILIQFEQFFDNSLNCLKST